MRIIVGCPQCHRQYDASRLSIGRKFRCHCGQVLEVQQPHGHDAAVVRCSSCGAPRMEGSLQCDHCGADFTLHERDLDTICPKCSTRVSDRARFCHYCGAHIHPESVAGEETEFRCPACGYGRQLVSRAWAQVSVMECQRCAGFWIGNEAFQQLTVEAAQIGTNVESRGPAKLAREAEIESPPPDGGARYRPCAACGQLMVRRNFGRQSGVIIDVCKYHGVWFDADELPRILDWIRAGGLAKANEEHSIIASEEEAERQKRARRWSDGRDLTSNSLAADDNGIGGFLLRLLGDFF